MNGGQQRRWLGSGAVGPLVHTICTCSGHNVLPRGGATGQSILQQWPPTKMVAAGRGQSRSHVRASTLLICARQDAQCVNPACFPQTCHQCCRGYEGSELDARIYRTRSAQYQPVHNGQLWALLRVENVPHAPHLQLLIQRYDVVG